MISKSLAEKSAVLFFTMSVAACATPQQVKLNEPVPTAADMHKISVNQTGVKMEIPTTADVMTPEVAAKLDEFGAAYRAYGHGPLILSTPNGANDNTARTAQAARMALVDKGVPYAAISGATYDATGRAGAPIMLSFSRYEAVAPACKPVWAENIAMTFTNQVSENFGCSLNANVAAMIADPADLKGARPIDPRDAARRDVVLDKYRQGQPTGAVRSEDERVTISTAVR
jgi:pilus assembly protein CpaD